MTLGQRIRQLRHKHGWTQQLLADKATMTTVAISEIELDKRSPNYGTLWLLANAFQISLSSMFEDVDMF